MLPVPKGVRNLLPTMHALPDCRFPFPQRSVIGCLWSVLPLVAQAVRPPVYVRYPLIICVSLVGVFAGSGSLFDLLLLAGCGLLGYLVRKLDYPTAPLILGLVLGGAMERALRQSLMMSE